MRQIPDLSLVSSSDITSGVALTRYGHLPLPELVILNSFKKEWEETGSSRYDFPHSEGQVENAPNELHPRHLTYPPKTSITCSSDLLSPWTH